MSSIRFFNVVILSVKKNILTIAANKPKYYLYAQKLLCMWNTTKFEQNFRKI
jgi:hypothetical protein